ncbi:hypothetical protein BUALT_Bualt07G0111900 [Buddleja alternifolia]|uniref:Neprosin activation peptide domain-containing protein n=1 Tax=Buddleja alternifolia TaxID=168488 RepID=A0AAV6XGV4_9LAMI|nr:hypothetical protein BUALT_Bualt07G0111900 [Buddleja alternifolia]
MRKLLGRWRQGLMAVEEEEPDRKPRGKQNQDHCSDFDADENPLAGIKNAAGRDGGNQRRGSRRRRRSSSVDMKPSYHPEGVVFSERKELRKNNEKGGNTIISQLWHMNGRWPQGTIPVRRTHKKDLLRASSIQNYGKKHTKATAMESALSPVQPYMGGDIKKSNSNMKTEFYEFQIQETRRQEG